MQGELPIGPTAPPRRYLYRRSSRARWRALGFLLAAALMGLAYRVAFPPRVAIRQRNVINYFGALPESEVPHPEAPPSRPGPRVGEAAPAGNPVSVRVYAPGAPPRALIEDLRQVGFPAEPVTERATADLVVPGTAPPAPPALSQVTAAGQVTLPAPPEAERRRRIFAEHLQPRGSRGGLGLLAGPGLLPEYDRVAAVAALGVRASRLNESAPVPGLAEPLAVRLVPELSYLEAGGRQGLDFQVLGSDGVWYSLTERSDVRFRVATETPAVVPHASVPYVFCSPAETDPRFNGQRVVIEATLRAIELPVLTARALIIVVVPRP